jgi:hypothetical protein
MAGEQVPRWIDATVLPKEFLTLVDSLAAGEELHILRDGQSIATVSGALGAFADGAIDHGDRAERPPLADENVTVVATAMKLSASARASLSGQLGPDYIVLDMNSAPRTADVILIPPVSPQLIGSLRSRFPKARVVVAEIEDQELGISYSGPVRRLLNAGADAYFPPTTVPRLAEQLDRTVTHLRQLAAAAPTPLIIESRKGDNHTNRRESEFTVRYRLGPAPDEDLA